MDIVIIAFVSFLASLLAFFSGFGLGTMLIPAFALFFPIDVAIILTSITHLLNNILKLFLIGKYADIAIVIFFGITSIIGAFIGAELFINLSNYDPILTYYIRNHQFEIIPINIIVSLLMLFFSSMEIIPYLKNIKFDSKKLLIGGIISGFFGGLSGRQGALRSAFLIKCGLSKESFIATGVILACLIDFTIIPIYLSNHKSIGIENDMNMLLTAVISAYVGTYIGNNLLGKIASNTLRYGIITTVVLIAIALGLGLL